VIEGTSNMNDAEQERIREYVQRCVDQAPPLKPWQRDRLAILLRDPKSPAPYRPPLVRVHYDEDDRCLFVGAAGTDLLRHVELRYSKRVELVPEPDAQTLDVVFGRLDRPAIEYLVAHDDLGWVMPVHRTDNNANPLPQAKPW